MKKKKVEKKYQSLKRNHFGGNKNLKGKNILMERNKENWKEKWNGSVKEKRKNHYRKKKYVRNCRIKEKREKYEGKKIKNGRIICIDEGKKKTEE